MLLQTFLVDLHYSIIAWLHVISGKLVSRQLVREQLTLDVDAEIVHYSLSHSLPAKPT